MNRKIFSLALAVLMLAGLGLVFIPAQANTPNYGDVDGNGIINSADVTLLRRRVAQGNENNLPSNYNRANADVNGDGFINATDVTLLRRYVAATDPSTVRLGPIPLLPVYGPNDKLLAITYDDGPDATITPRVLNHWLAQDNAFTTFFVNGSKFNATTRPIVQRMIREGHAVENHGWDHRTFGALGGGGYGGPQITTVSEAVNNINQCSQEIFNTTGIWPWCFRPPFFQMGSHMNGIDLRSDILKRPGQSKLHVVRGAWLDTLDWQVGTGQSMADKVLEFAPETGSRHWSVPWKSWQGAPFYYGADGGMILFHDIYTWTADAVPLFLPELYRRGYVCVTVQQLYESPKSPGPPPNHTQFGEEGRWDWAY
jgi:peptidoglycan/xylan/chitin deacetylase (PgdA/CDA1 family)